MQLTYNISKKEAVDKYLNKYVTGSKRQTSKIRKDVKNYIDEQYPKHQKIIPKPSPHRKTKEQKSRKEKEKYVSKEKIVSQKPFSKKYINFESWLRAQKRNKKLDTKGNRRIIKAHSKYPNDTLQQLRKGHNRG